MKPTDLKCRPQVVAVIGEPLADYELQRVIDCDKCEKGDTFEIGFYRVNAPQGGKFWADIGEGKNPYDHGHEKPKVKEWVYIRDTDEENESAWYFKDMTIWDNPKGGFYDLGSEFIEIIATHKSVTMPDWVPEEKAFGIDGAFDHEPKGVDFGSNLILQSSVVTTLNTTNKYKVKCKGVEIDVYDVLLAYGVTNPADQHAIKKMLMPGKRGVKDASQDRKEAIQSLERAIELASASE